MKAQDVVDAIYAELGCTKDTFKTALTVEGLGILAGHLARMSHGRITWVQETIESRNVQSLTAIAALLEEADQFQDSVYHRLGMNANSFKQMNTTNTFLRIMKDPGLRFALARLVKKSRIF